MIQIVWNSEKVELLMPTIQKGKIIVWGNVCRASVNWVCLGGLRALRCGYGCETERVEACETQLITDQLRLRNYMDNASLSKERFLRSSGYSFKLQFYISY